MIVRKYLRQILILIGLSWLLFVAGNGIIGLTDPDEVFYAETAKEMARHKDWLVPYIFDLPQFEKPILTYWLLRISFLMFGISEFSARFFPAIFASIGVVSVYLFSIIAYRDEKKAFLSSLILMSSAIYLGLAKSLFTDMIFSIFILLSLLSFFWGYSYSEKKTTGVLLFFCFSGLAVLTKGPLGFLIPFLTVIIFLFIKRWPGFILCRDFLLGFIIFCLLGLPWYIFMLKRYGANFIYEFFYNDHIRRIFEAEHPANDRWYFYPLSIIGCLFPWSIYLFGSFCRLFKNLKDEAPPIYLFLFCWFCVVFLIFQTAHSKLISYIFPLFPALALIIGDFVYNSAKRFIGRYAIISVFGVIVLLFFAVFIFHNNFEPYISCKIPCGYLVKNYTIDNYILCSKKFVRGVKYYTDKEVAVVDINGKGFFSPHPIPYLNSNKVLADFLRSQAVTYCVLSSSSADDIESKIGEGFKIETLKIICDKYILRIKS